MVEIGKVSPITIMLVASTFNYLLQLHCRVHPQLIICKVEWQTLDQFSRNVLDILSVLECLTTQDYSIRFFPTSKRLALFIPLTQVISTDHPLPHPRGSFITNGETLYIPPHHPTQVRPESAHSK